jgi:exopolyphosphatase/guanosine-5'-triphosphate,3'-diphosphate pyrophosphatase
MITFGAIDLGSNAMRLAVGRFSPDGTYKILATHREPVRLGQDVFRTRRITPALMDQGVAGFLAFDKILRKYKVKMVRAVATSAMRDATNGTIFIERVARATGIRIEIISGDEEARLIHQAVSSVMNITAGTKLLIDIGGGSVELSLLHRGKVLFADSVPMGTVRLLEMLRGRKQPERVLKRLIRQYGQGIRRQLKRRIGSAKVSCAIATGGNVEALGELRKELLGEPSNELIRRSELQQIMEIVQSKSVRERIEHLNLRPDRADVIVPATALLLGILQEAGTSTLKIPHVGLREGILVDMFEKNLEHSREAPLEHRRKQMIASAVQLGRQFRFDEQHAKHVAKLSLQIFDGTKPLHRMGLQHRLLLEISALVHDIGYFINSADHHKHSSYIVENSAFMGLREEQRNLVSAIVRYHTGSSPSLDHPQWQALDVEQRTCTRVLAGILRIVEELDKEHLRRVREVSIRKTKSTITLRLIGQGPLLVERWGIDRRKELLESCFKRKIVVTQSRNV